MSYPAGPPTPPHQGGPPYGAPAVCVRHPDRATGLSCTRCDRPSCPECLREASVGYQCVDCVAEGRRDTPRARVVRTAARPVVVPILIALNVAVFVWTVIEAGDLLNNFTSELYQQWVLVPGYVQLGQWWRVLTSGFLHVADSRFMPGPLHLLVNMLALWVLGRDVEALLGRSRFLAVYLVSLLGGAAAVMLFYEPNQAVAGASGAVFGLMGALAVVLQKLRIPASQVIVLVAVNVGISLVIPGISLIGHLGGLVAGAAATAALVYAPARNRTVVQVAALVGLTVVLVLLIGVTALG